MSTQSTNRTQVNRSKRPPYYGFRPGDNAPPPKPRKGVAVAPVAPTVAAVERFTLEGEHGLAASTLAALLQTDAPAPSVELQQRVFANALAIHRASPIKAKRSGLTVAIRAIARSLSEEVDDSQRAKLVALTRRYGLGGTADLFIPRAA